MPKKAKAGKMSSSSSSCISRWCLRIHSNMRYGPKQKGRTRVRPGSWEGAVARFLVLAEWTGLEPATPGVTGRYSNQLNYHSLPTFFAVQPRVLVGAER